MSTRTLALVLRVFLLVVPLLSWVGMPSVAEALPMYAQRSGRTCANCHVSPTLEDEKGWENPELMTESARCSASRAT